MADGHLDNDICGMSGVAGILVKVRVKDTASSFFLRFMAISEL